MMTRRETLTLIAGAIPMMAVPSALSALAVPHHQYLEDTRRILFPALSAVFSDGSTEPTIEIHHDMECLIVAAWRQGVEPLGFAITRESIKSGHYKAEFGPNCRKLRDLITAGRSV